MKILSKSIILISLMMALLRSEFSVLYPDSLKKALKHSKLNFNIFDFGIIPYGKTIYGEVVLSQPADACSNVSHSKSDLPNNAIVLIERGSCHFSVKLKNYQDLGAIMVIVYDVKPDSNAMSIFPVEKTDNIMHQLKIPGVIISGEFGSKIKEEITRGNNVGLSLNFKLRHSISKANLNVILSVDSYHSYVFMDKFNAIAKPLSSLIDLKIEYRVQKRTLNELVEGNCVKSKNNQFCIESLSRLDPIKNKLIRESIFQKCIFSQNPNFFYSYLKSVGESCFDRSSNPIDNFLDCSDKLKNDHNVSLKCDINDNSDLIDKFNVSHLCKMHSTIQYSPIIFINERYFKGDFLNIEELLKRICLTFENIPEQCSSYLNVIDESSVSLTKILLYSISVCSFILVICLILSYIVYKRIFRKRFGSKLKTEINRALAEYYSNEEEKDGIDS